MAITRVKTSSILQNFPKERSMLAGNDGDTGAYESIATVEIGAGGATFIDFTSIPQTYQHLQIRCLLTTATVSGADIIMRFNSDSGSNYSRHQVDGYNGSARSVSVAPSSSMSVMWWRENYPSVSVIDILDYKDTNKYTTIRALFGHDNNNSGVPTMIALASGNWRNTAAITSIRIDGNGATMGQYSKFALYGIR